MSRFYKNLLISLVLLSNHGNSRVFEYASHVFKRDYCSINCNGELHTMCKYKGPSSCDINVTYLPESGENLLDLHNVIRQNAADGSLEWQNISFPQASNMRLMAWDPELATIAHRWLTQCIFGHDKCRNTDEEVGQTVGYLTENEFGKNPDAREVYYGFLPQLDFMTTSHLKSFNNDSEISDISQILWAKTYKLGCSEAIYNMNNERTKAVVCNYAPKGANAGKSIYDIGPSCSECPAGTRCNINPYHRTLCSREGDYGEYDFELNSDCDHSICAFLLPSIFALILLGKL